MIGPYNGGFRFHASLTLSIVMFLALEQTFKNSLITLPVRRGKGGFDFSPKGKSSAAIVPFCQDFVTELSGHIDPNIDVSAGDIRVGGSEIWYMFRMYSKLAREFTEIFTRNILHSEAL